MNLNGARRGNRTPNLLITNQLRYQLRHAGKIDAGDQPYQGQDPSWHLQLTTFRVQKNVAKQSDSFVSSSTPEFSVTRYLEPYLSFIAGAVTNSILRLRSALRRGLFARFLPSCFGGAGGNRTLDPLLARQVLSHLSYNPIYFFNSAFSLRFLLSFSYAANCLRNLQLPH